MTSTNRLKTTFTKFLKLFLIITIIIFLFIVIIFFISDDEPPITSEQEGWIKEMEKNYPDDSFTYEGHPTEQMFTYHADEILISSQLFPDQKFFICKKDGVLCSNYPNRYHDAAINDHIKCMVENNFNYDKLETRYSDLNSEDSIEYVSDAEYIENKIDGTFIVYLFYNDNYEYPDNDKIVSSILKSVEGNEKYCNITFFFFRGDVESLDSGWDYQYSMECKDGHISHLYKRTEVAGEKEAIITDMDFSEALKKYE